MKSCSSALVRVASFFTANSFGVSPECASGTPTTAHSRSPPWLMATSSTSFGNTLKPETLIMSFLRSTMRTRPCTSMTPTSPVRKKPSAVITFAVSSGRCQ